ncbi:MAG: NAD(P)H-dependent oxidoreductase [Aerococcus sp.]|nr:NAD(P)H-dependent oxidoreductase [Aerococcus sp.]
MLKEEKLVNITILCGVPEIENSASHQFLKASVPDGVYFEELVDNPDDETIKHYQQLLLDADRFFLEFPLYWYQAPGIISDWCADIFTDAFIQKLKRQDDHKEFGVIISVGTPLSDYQKGGRQGFSLSEILTPFATIAHYFHFTYLTPFVLSQYMYMTDVERREKLVEYQQHLLLPRNASFTKRAHLIIDQIEAMGEEVIGDTPELLTMAVEDDLNKLDDLRQQIKWQEANE